MRRPDRKDSKKLEFFRFNPGFSYGVLRDPLRGFRIRLNNSRRPDKKDSASLRSFLYPEPVFPIWRLLISSVFVHLLD